MFVIFVEYKFLSIVLVWFFNVDYGVWYIVDFSSCWWVEEGVDNV